MTYFADLTPYTFLDSERQPGLLNVGWLGPKHEFAVRESPPEFVAALGRLCAREKAAQTRGFHVCTLGACKRHPERTSVTIDGREVLLGSAEIRVKADGGTVFAAPDLIYHYVTTHGYRPPAEFIAVVLMS